MLFLTVTLFISIYFHIYKICGLNNYPSSISNIPIIITNIEQKKLHYEIKGKSTDYYEYPGIKMILYHNGDIILNEGDEVLIHKTIKNRFIDKTEDNHDNHKLHGIFFISSIIDNDITIISKGNPGIRTILRQKFNNSIDTSFKKDTAGMVKALLTANRSSVSKDTIIKFRDSGALHLLAASGLHIGIAAGFPFFLLFFSIRKKTVLMYSLLFVLLYLLITEMPISLIRAFLMFLLFVLQAFLHRRSSALNILMVTGIIIILISPWDIYNTAFQLSYGATMGIILFYELYYRSLNHFPTYIRKSIAVTLSAQIFTVPLILYHLNQINTISILSNIILIPMITVFMYSSFSAIVLTVINPNLKTAVSLIPECLYKTIVQSAGFFADFNFNFYINNNINPVLLLMSLSLIPLIKLKIPLKIKYFPIIAAYISCTVYLKSDTKNIAEETVISTGTSTITLNLSKEPELILDINDFKDIKPLADEINRFPVKIKNVTIKNNSYPNLIACRHTCSFFIIDECRFSVLPDINNTLKKLICSLEADKVKVIFPAD